MDIKYLLSKVLKNVIIDNKEVKEIFKKYEKQEKEEWDRIEELTGYDKQYWLQREKELNIPLPRYFMMEFKKVIKEKKDKEEIYKFYLLSIHTLHITLLRKARTFELERYAGNFFANKSKKENKNFFLVVFGMDKKKKRIRVSYTTSSKIYGVLLPKIANLIGNEDVSTL